MFANRLFREPIEPPRFRVSFDLSIPLIVKINLSEFVKKLAFLPLTQSFHGLDDFRHGAHAGNLTETFPMTSLRGIELRLGEEAVEGARQKKEGFTGVIGNSQVNGGSS